MSPESPATTPTFAEAARFWLKLGFVPGSIRGAVIDEGEWEDIGSLEAYEKLKKGGDGQ